ncbi:hypothetical protein ACI3LY_001099 [Candidozyma auris]|uniref:F-box domain-containing protein n=2 Tax=Candidozyma auris TaxID=498019 RepID=A0AB36W3F4_CANAR|nr:hypothetical protein QG37_04433 [[Candida] auris]PIS50616.1 hypothetical protein B9J08_004444 [[Candida] auris]PIS50968.1 hypothetical protein CJI97_004508 [[Candida] auris]QWW25644.1 hypothetical protein CA7LBN_004531 [[Candida] auris]
MLQLPSDVIVRIASYLPQEDKLNLAKTCSELYNTLHPLMYEVIVLDSSRVHLNELQAFVNRHKWFEEYGFDCYPTVVRSLYALTRLLKNLSKNVHLCKYIKYLVASENIPDMPHVELVGFLSGIIPKLTNLSSFQWYSVHQPLDAHLMSQLPSRVQQVRGNLQFSSAFSTFSLPESVEILDISNFGCEKNLYNLVGFPEQLSSLTVSKSVSPSSRMFTTTLSPCCSAVLSNTQESIYLDAPTYISSLFNSLSLDSPIKLISLKLRDISVSVCDAHILKNYVDLACLTSLALEDCTEILFDHVLPHNYISSTSSAYIRRNAPAELFLDLLVPELTSLRSLHISMTNELYYNNCIISSIAALKGLEKISVHLKYLYRASEPIDLDPLVEALEKHAPTLRYLDVCFNTIDNNVSPGQKKKQCSLSTGSLARLSNLTQLEYLKIPVFRNQMDTLHESLQHIPNLKIVQVGVTDSGSNTTSNGDTLIYALYNTNCLISQDYFTSPNSFTSSIHDEKKHEYLTLSEKFKNSISSLRYMRYDLKNQSLVYDCHGAVTEAEDGAVENFDTLVSSVMI